MKRRTRARMCAGKVPHESREAARGQLRSLFRRNGAVRMRAYRCPFCKSWHVGHLPKPRY